MPDVQPEEKNRALVRDSFERWTARSGGPFELMAPNVLWTIKGSSPYSRTYRGMSEFWETVGKPFNDRMASPPKRELSDIFADGDHVVSIFDIVGKARDGLDYRNTYVWSFEMQNGKVVKVTAVFDTRVFDDFMLRPMDGPISEG